MKSGLETIGRCFSRLNVDSQRRPGHYAFFVPNTLGYTAWPNFPETAKPQQGRVGRGRGLTEKACQLSGLGEAVERASCCKWSNEQLITARFSDVVGQAIPIEILTGFSEAQLHNRAVWNKEFAGEDWCPPPVLRSKEIKWCQAKSELSGEEQLVPADFVLLGQRKPGDDDAVAIANSSGCAAAPSMELAKLWSLLELVERDAVGRWWFGARKRSRLDLASLDVEKTLFVFLQRRKRKTVLLDISTDLWQPILAAASWDTNGTKVAFGFSAGLSIAQAAESALIEMLQTEIGIEQRLSRNEDSIRLWCSTVRATHFPFEEMFKAPIVNARARKDISCSPSTTLERIITDCAAQSISVFFIDRTRPEFGVPVVRAIAPGLCSDKPRWGFKRLQSPDGLDLARLQAKRQAPPNPVALRV